MFSGQLDNCTFVYILEEMNDKNHPFQTPTLFPRPPHCPETRGGWDKFGENGKYGW